MQAEARLQQHYETKYVNADAKSVVPTPLVQYPRDRFEQAVSLATNNARGDLLEVGAGGGSILLAVQERYDSVTATDLSFNRVRELKSLFANNRRVHVLQNNIEGQSEVFADASFDTILMVAIIEHVFDPILVLKELHRMLKPGGRLILDTPNIAKWTRRIKLAFGYFPSTASLDEGLRKYEGGETDLHDEGHLHYFTFDGLSRIATERVGFSVVEQHGYGSLACRVWPSLFSEISLVLYK